MTPEQLGKKSWQSALEWAVANPDDMTRDHHVMLAEQADRWDQCAMCELPIKHRDGRGGRPTKRSEPRIADLWLLGIDFSRQVYLKKYRGALDLLDQIREMEITLYGECYG